ncbi:MAG: AraC family transcriptional regulator [Clostridia bacterium]|nr:AraC family transcriptional regulator [Clostridia bacterium]
MSETGSVSLIEALKQSIKTIEMNYSGNWVVTGGNENPGKLKSEQAGRNDSNYDKVVEISSHDFVEMFVCVEGCCALQLEDHVFEIGKGDVGVILPGVSHIELPIKGCTYTGIWIVAHTGRTALHVSGKNSQGFFIADGFTFDTEHNAMLNSIILNMSIEAKNKLPYNIEIVKTYILQVLMTCLRNVENSRNLGLTGVTWKDSVVSDVQNYIEWNYQKQIRVEDISRLVCISNNYLNTIFKAATGKTIMRYIEDFKIDKAMHLLKTTDLSIKEISIRLGYYDQYHFSKMFKKRQRSSPKQFREDQIMPKA